MINTPFGNHSAIPGKPKRRKAREVWTSTETGSLESLAESFRQEREKILRHLSMIYREINHLNKHRFSENPIQFAFDFTDDVREIKAKGKR